MKEIFTSSTFSGLNRQIEEFFENYEVYDWEAVTIVTEKVVGEYGEYHWKATLRPKYTEAALKDVLVEDHRIVS